MIAVIESFKLLQLAVHNRKICEPDMFNTLDQLILDLNRELNPNGYVPNSQTMLVVSNIFDLEERYVSLETGKPIYDDDWFIGG